MVWIILEKRREERGEKTCKIDKDIWAVSDALDTRDWSWNSRWPDIKIPCTRIQRINLFLLLKNKTKKQRIADHCCHFDLAICQLKFADSTTT